MQSNITSRRGFLSSSATLAAVLALTRNVRAAGTERFWGTYPAKINGRTVDRVALDEVFAPVDDFVKQHSCPILIGEFSAPRWVNEHGNRYVRDVIELCEQRGWSWAYHSFRSAHVWDAEMSNTDANDQQRRESTPRLELLREYFQRNR